MAAVVVGRGSVDVAGAVGWGCLEPLEQAPASTARAAKIARRMGGRRIWFENLPRLPWVLRSPQ